MLLLISRCASISRPFYTAAKIQDQLQKKRGLIAINRYRFIKIHIHTCIYILSYTCICAELVQVGEQSIRAGHYHMIQCSFPIVYNLIYNNTIFGASLHFYCLSRFAHPFIKYVLLVHQHVLGLKMMPSIMLT